MRKSLTKKSKPKDTQAAQHARFVATVKALGAPDDAREFDKAFKRVTSAKKHSR
jgi:hypothetical protein